MEVFEIRVVNCVSCLPLHSAVMQHLIQVTKCENVFPALMSSKILSYQVKILHLTLANLIHILESTCLTRRQLNWQFIEHRMGLWS